MGVDKIQQVSEKEYYSKFAVSNSSLSWFQQSPKYFIAQLNGEIKDETPRTYFELGRQIHMRVLETEDFFKTYAYVDVDLPSSKQQKEFAKKYLDSKLKTKEEKSVEAYTETYTTKGKSDAKIQEIALETYGKLSRYIDYLERTVDAKVILPWNTWQLINGCAKEMLNHKACSSMLVDDPFGNIESYNELPIFWEWKGVKCKSMLDRVVIDHDNKVIKLIDVKTTSNIYGFGKSFAKFGYYRQCAYYWLALKYWIDNNTEYNIEDYTQETYILATNKDEQVPEVRVFQVEEYQLLDGINEIEELMPLIKWHFDNDKWDHDKEYYEGNGIVKISRKDYIDGKA